MANTTKRYNPLINLFNICWLTALPLAVVLLPADFFDSGRSVCLSITLFDQTCYGCGMTRAVQHAMHFDFKTAYAFNPLVGIVLPLLILAWGMEFKRQIRIYKKSRPQIN